MTMAFGVDNSFPFFPRPVAVKVADTSTIKIKKKEHQV